MKLERLFGWLIAGWLAGSVTHEITVHVLSEQYFSLTTINQNNIFQSCRTNPCRQKAARGLKRSGGGFGLLLLLLLTKKLQHP